MSIKNSKKDFLKLLAKTSVVAMAAASAGSAFAGAARVTTIDPGTGDNATGVTANFNPDAGGPYGAADWIQLGAADHNITINTANTFTGIDLGTKVATGTLTVTDAADGKGIGSIGNGGVGAALGLVLSDAGGAYTFTLNGTKTDAAPAVAADTYDGLGTVKIGNNATLAINAAGAILLAGNIEGGSDSKGTLKISSATTLTGNVGNTNTLNIIDVDAGLTFEGAANQVVKTTGGITVADGKTLTADSTNGTIDIYGVVHGDNHAPAAATTLAVTGGNKVTFHNKVGTNSGGITKAFDAITTGAGEVVFGDTVDATTITTGAGAVTFNGSATGAINLDADTAQIVIGDSVIVTGSVDNANNKANTKITFTNADGQPSKITGLVGNANAISEIITGAGAVEFGGVVKAGTITTDAGDVAFDAAVTATTINAGAGAVTLSGLATTDVVFKNDGSNLILGANLAGNITTANDGKGTVTVTGNNRTITGAIGGAGASIEKVHFATNHQLTLDAQGKYYTNFTTATADEGVLILNDAGAYNLYGDIVNLDYVSVDANITLNLHGSSTTNAGIRLNDNNATLNIHQDNANINKVVSEGAERGVLGITAGVTGVTLGNIGNGAGTAIQTLSLADGSSATLTENAFFNAGVGDGGIRFAGNSTLTVNDGVQLSFVNNGNTSDIDAAGHGEGTLILNGQNINVPIGTIRRLHTVRAASGDVTLSAGVNVDNLEIANGASVKITEATLNAANGIAPYMNAETTKLILDGDVVGYNHTVGAAGIGAISEVHFSGAENHSLTVTNGGGAAVFNALSVTSDGAAKNRTITIESAGDMDIPTNFSSVDGKQLTKLHINSKNNGDHTFGLRGDVLNVADITFEKPNHASVHALRAGLNADNSKYKPQIIIGNINGANGGGGELNFEIAGHTFIEGDVTGNIDTVKFVSDDKRLYSSGAISGINFEHDGQLYFFKGNHAINNDIVVGNNKTAGCIVARGVTADVAKTKFAAGDENFNIDAEIYGDTLTINKAVGDIGNNARLQMIDAGKGTVVFSDGGGGGGVVNVDKVNAKTVVFDRVATFNIGTLMDINSGGNVEEIIIQQDPTIAANSTLLGTKDNALKVRLVTPGAVAFTLQDNVNINVEQGGVKRIEDGGGHKLAFEGNSQVWSEIGSEMSKFNTVVIAPQAADQTVTFYNNVHTAAGTILTDGAHKARINLHGNITGSVLAAGNGQGIVTISGSGKTIDQIGVIGGDAVDLVNINTDNTSVTGDLNVDNINFSKDGTLTISSNAEVNNAITASSNDTGTLIVKGVGGAFTPNAQIGDDQSRVKLVQLGENANEINLAHAVDGHNTLIIPRADNLGDLGFNGKSISPNLDIGLANKKFAFVNFGGDVTFRDGHATKYDLNGNNVTFRAARGLTQLNNGTANVIHDGYIKATGAGTVNITGNAEIAGAGLLGDAVTALNVTTQGVVATLTASEIHATNVNHSDSTINASSPVTLNGTYTATNATLGTKGRFEVAGNAVLAKSFTLNDTSSEGVALDLSNSVNVNIAGLSSLTINLDAQNGASLSEGRQVLAFNKAYDETAGNAFALLLDKTSISTNHPLFSNVSLVRTPNSKYATLATEFTAEQAVKDLKGLSGGEKTALVHALTVNQDNLALINDLALNGSEQGGFDAAARRWAGSEFPNAATAGVDALMSEISEIATGRVTSSLASATAGALPSAAAAADAGQMVGVAAGDNAEKFGVWASAMGNIAKQEKRRNSTAFKTNMYGGLVGIDTLLSDKVMAGFALGNAQGNVKFKDFKLGDKIKSSTWVFTGYGSYSINDNWFVRGAITGSSTKVNSSEKRTGQNTGVTYAKGKYSVEAFSAEAAVGYNYRTQGGGTLTPSFGVRLGRVNDIEYKETGSGVQSKEVKHNASHTTSLLLGTQYSTTQYWDDMVVTPEAHVNVRYDHGVKTPKGKFKALGTNTFSSYSGDKPSNLNVNFGAGVTSHVDNVEYGIGYDLHLADKYTGHQGTVKVKLKF